MLTLVLQILEQEKVILVPQLTIDSVQYIKGMIEANTYLLNNNKHYKLNDEIYYSNDNKFLYRIDI